jgi:hypothetical protein
VFVFERGQEELGRDREFERERVPERSRFRVRGRERHCQLVPDVSSRGWKSSRRSDLVDCELRCVTVAPDTGILTDYYRRQIQ